MKTENKNRKKKHTVVSTKMLLDEHRITCMGCDAFIDLHQRVLLYPCAKAWDLLGENAAVCRMLIVHLAHIRHDAHSPLKPPFARKQQVAALELHIPRQPSIGALRVFGKWGRSLMVCRGSPASLGVENWNALGPRQLQQRLRFRHSIHHTIPWRKAGHITDFLPQDIQRLPEP